LQQPVLKLGRPEADGRFSAGCCAALNFWTSRSPHIHGARQVAHPWGGRPRLRASPERSARSLRREGLYSSALVGLAAVKRAAGAFEALSPAKRGPQNRRTKTRWRWNLRFRGETTSALKLRLERAEAIIEIQKKVAVLLGLQLRATTSLDGRRGGLGASSGLIAAACTALGLSRASLHRPPGLPETAACGCAPRGQRQCGRLSRKSAKSYSTC